MGLLLLLPLVPMGAASHNCQPVANVPDLAGIWRCDEDRDGWQERTEVRVGLLQVGTVLILGLAPDAAYVSAPTTGTTVSYARHVIAGYTYDCAHAQANHTGLVSACDRHHFWGTDPQPHWCHVVQINNLPQVRHDCPDPPIHL
jgi:hypothetical protein